MCRQFNIQQFYVLPTQCIYVFCMDLRTNRNYFPIQHYLTGFYKRDEVCLLRGTDWVFMYNSCLILILGYAMTQAVSRRPLTTEVRIR